jgi:hypothetical protein
MRLPDADNAHVPREKLTGYLLSETHPVGRFKAHVFRSVGFDDTNVDLLEQGLLTVARSQEVAKTETTPHGEKYVVNGPLPAPDGTVLLLCTVWIIEPEGPGPRFVTAYPL